MMNINHEDVFDAYYYAHGCGRTYKRDEEWLRFFGDIAERIIQDIQPTTVLDAGCAWGFLVENLRHRGVQAFGVDLSEYAIQQVSPEISSFCWRDSIVKPFPDNYDLIVSIEVLEHMSPSDAAQAIVNFCQHSDDILFSSTPFDYKEVTHFNVQPPEVWAQLFARQGFYRDVDFDASFLTPWAVRFRRRDEPTHRVVREYERRFWLLWKENTDLRSLVGELRDEISEISQKLGVNEGAIQALEAQRDEIFDSRSWRLIQKIQKIRQILNRKDRGNS
jgi:SAM-dependent methyltransferase